MFVLWPTVGCSIDKGRVYYLWLLTGGTVIPVSLIAVVPTVLEKSVF